MSAVGCSGIWWCQWCTHGSTAQLFPESIPKLKDVVVHDQTKSRDNCISRNRRKKVRTIKHVAVNACDSSRAVDVCVHGGCVSSEEMTTSWDYELGEFVFQFKGAFDEALEGSSN